jgi:hypothetical protein
MNLGGVPYLLMEAPNEAIQGLPPVSYTAIQKNTAVIRRSFSSFPK